MYTNVRLILCSIVFCVACNNPKIPDPTPIVEIKPDTIITPIKKKPVLILDAGHGGPDPGATSDTMNIHEKNVCRNLVDAIYKKIDTNKISVILTRKKDEDFNRHERITYANTFHPDLFLSIHNNFSKDTTISGFEIDICDSTIMSTTLTDTVRVKNPSKDSSLKYVNIIDKNLRSSFPKMIPRKLALRKDNIWVLVAPKYPSMIVEFGFITNRSDLKYLTDKKEIENFASSITKSIYNIFNVSFPKKEKGNKKQVKKQKPKAKK